MWLHALKTAKTQIIGDVCSIRGWHHKLTNVAAVAAWELKHPLRWLFICIMTVIANQFDLLFKYYCRSDLDFNGRKWS